jgi:hypothetical protein
MSNSRSSGPTSERSEVRVGRHATNKNAGRTSCRDPVELELTEEDHRLELFGVTLQRLTILRLYPTTLNHFFCCVADGA